MRIFISWSGERSRLVGELIDEWIRCVLQAVDPWISSNDIDRGSLWFTEINDQLRDVSIGIICLTKENKDKPWILFEAGALLKGLSTSRICTLLVDLEPKDIEDPLAQLNHTKPNKDGMRKLVKSLNVALGEQKLNDRVVNDVFEMYYPKFEESFAAILKDTPETTPVKVRDKEDVMDEMLNVLRGLDKRVRGLERDSRVDYLHLLSNPAVGPGKPSIFDMNSDLYAIKNNVKKTAKEYIFNNGQDIGGLINHLKNVYGHLSFGQIDQVIAEMIFDNSLYSTAME